MLGLPKSTEMWKQLPKKAVYAKFHLNTAAKEKIDADISKITCERGDHQTKSMFRQENMCPVYLCFMSCSNVESLK